METISKTETDSSSSKRIQQPKCKECWALLLLTFASFLGSGGRADASGTWSTVNPPPSAVVCGHLLSDGTVMLSDYGSSWIRLTPDIHGSYVNGTWTTLASMHYTRLFYSTQVLTNGNLYVAGGEYGTGATNAELYNTLNNTWTVISTPGNFSVGDAISSMLPDGNVLQGSWGGAVWIYNVAANTMTTGPSSLNGNQDEACWVRLPNDNILTIDPFGQNSEHYVPSLNAWYADGTTPVGLYDYLGEIGAGFVLPTGKAFYIGANPVTVIYTPGTSLTAAGSWVEGQNMGVLGALDAPACMMTDGNILCSLGPTNGYTGPTYMYEYNYIANTFTQVSNPNGTDNNAPYGETMLQLPDGSVLFIDGEGTTALYTYMPNGTPLVSGKPVIGTITKNANGSYHLTGIGLNGMSVGAAYGDDHQMSTAYPIVRLTNNVTGNVYYARTYGWSSTSIQNPNPVTTEFTLPSGLPSGTYSLVAVVNGNPSAPVTFTPGASVTVANGTYSITDVPGYFLNDPNGGGSGTGVDQVPYNNVNQQWDITSVGNGEYAITSVQNGLALSGPTTYSQLILQTYTGASDQLWTIRTNAVIGNYLNFINVATGQAMDDWAGGGNGVMVGQWTAQYSNLNQIWALIPVKPVAGTHLVVNQSSGQALDDPGFSTMPGQQLDQWDINGGANQQWTFVPNPDGSYTIYNVYSGLVVDDYQGATGNGSPVDQWTSIGGDTTQHWYVTQNADGSYTINNVNSGKDLEDPGASTTEGQLLDQWTDAGASWEHWLLW